MTEFLAITLGLPIYKEKGSREICKNHRGISLLSIPVKVYGRKGESDIKMQDRRFNGR